MIKINNLEKKYETRNGQRTILRNINLTIERGQKIGILGRNGSGKSTLLRIIGGAENPTSGSITRNMKVSWPLAFAGGFQGSLTGLDNLKFICRIYEADIQAAIPFVEEFSELGTYFREPVKRYSAGMRARLAFALSMAVEFDCYLIDEVMAVGDSRFHDKCHYELFEKRKDRSLIIVSHIPEAIRDHCDTFYVMKDGMITQYKDVDQAYEYYEQNN
ncbi:ABC transporter ATP-binding protein [Chitinibacter sp. SCUT-21]|uniref:ABC transporter ATP-binding protein n=1 Tax=Chitinibacter sp. SCUT-21 TaxID=2970891 RepID=UPI0035A58E14